mgnify:CR=1 FL=1
MSKNVLLVLAGLAAGVIGGALFVGRATAQPYPQQGGYAPPPPQIPQGARVQYLCQREFPRVWEQNGMNQLNALGAQGWELVQQLPANPDVFCFKRRY